MSQQNASRRLVLLERGGDIERKNNGIKITPLGLKKIASFYYGLKEALEGVSDKLQFKGKIVLGLGEGRYYVSKYAKRIKKALGFEPYVGTLNVKLNKQNIEKRFLLTNRDAVIIKGFMEKGRSFGDIFAYPCSIDGNRAAVIIPVRTHHGVEILEIISSKNLLTACRKGIGDSVVVSID